MLRKRFANYICTDCRKAFSSSRTAAQDARPPTAPQQHPDIALIRKNVELFEHNTTRRNYPKHALFPGQIARDAQKSTDINAKLLPSRRRLKELDAGLHTAGKEKTNALDEIRKLKPGIDELVKEQDELDNGIRTMALSLPNLTSAQTPVEEHRLLRYINYDSDHPPQYSQRASHSEIGEHLSLLNFTAASTTSGWGFYYLLNEAALLEQALIQYALAVAMRFGWKIVSPPSLVYTHVTESCGFQPRDQNDEQQIWQVAQPAKDIGKPKRSLAATAEIPLAGLYASKDIPEDQLPIKLVGTSRCYRAEAGARGVDTKGLYRVHEFTKVEMFGWTDGPSTKDGLPDETQWTKHSTEVFDEMVKIQTEILQSLGLPCRVLEMPSSDLGASAYRKIDIEAMFPSRSDRDGGWGEVTSASICTDYQSRRLDTRIKEKSGSRKRFPHTVNGTAMAIPRIVAALLENGWQDGESGRGYVAVPEVLQPYMGGLQKIGPRD